MLTTVYTLRSLFRRKILVGCT